MQKSRGFTMVELMVVVAIIAILTTLAAPSFKQLIQSNTISNAANTFLADTRYARSESIKRGSRVIMCRSDAPEAANPVCDSGSGPGGNGWVSGWIVFVDANGDSTRNASSTAETDPLLRIQSPISTINSIIETSSPAKNKFQFTATGRLYLSSATSLQFGGNPEFSNEVQRMVCVNVGGRARIAGDGYTSC